MAENEKKDKNYYYSSLISYIENSIPSEIENTFRDKILVAFLSKYVKTLKSIKILDNLGFFEECDILVRSLYEIVVQVGYLELNPEENYERLDLYRYYEDKKVIEQMSKEFNADTNNVSNMDKINAMTDIYESKEYKGSKSYWNGLNIKDTAKEVDNSWKEKYKAVSLVELYFVIYKINCLFCHNSVKILESNYIKMNEDGLEYNVNPNPDEKNLDSCNSVILISYNLVNACLPNIFTKKTDIFKEFDSYLGSILKKV